jgi:hypothetical protein
LSKLKKLQKSEVAFYPYESENNISFYSRERDKNLISPLLNYIKNYISEEKIRVWDK